MNNIRDIQRINEIELEKGLIDKASWHDEFKKSAYIYVGGLSFDLTEGDVIAIFSQFGEIVDVDLVRDMKSGKSMGFAFVGFEDQRSTVLSVDNFNGIDVLERKLRVDHAVYDGRRKGFKESHEDYTNNQKERRMAVLPKHLKPKEDGDVSSEEETVKQLKVIPLDLNDPMGSYFYKKAMDKQKRKEEKKSKKRKNEDNKMVKSKFHFKS